MKPSLPVSMTTLIVVFTIAVVGRAAADESHAILLSKVFSTADDEIAAPVVRNVSAEASVPATPYVEEGIFMTALGGVHVPATFRYEPTGFGGGNGYNCGCGCDPRWTLRAGMLWMQRDNPNNAVLVTTGDLVTPVLNASQFNFDFAPGFELDVIRHNAGGSGWDLEARFFNVDNMNASVPTVLSPGGAFTSYLIPLGNGLPSTITGSYDSSLLSTELNVRRQAGPDWLTVLAGFRYLRLNEEGATIVQDIGPGLNLATIGNNSNNDLFGAQLGAEIDLLTKGRLNFNTFGKAGIYANHNSNDVFISQSAFPATFASSDSSTTTAFVGELGFVGAYRITDSLSLRSTYQLMWVEGVALASDQVAVSNPLLGTATVDTDGTFYQGFFVGLEYTR